MSITPQGFEVFSVVGNLGTYQSYDVYGFDNNELMMGIRIKNLTGILPTVEDANYCLSIICDETLTLAQQNTLINNFMFNKYPQNVPS